MIPASERGFSVRIHIPSGVPDGLRVIEKSNWSGKGVVFPRALLPEARKRPELRRAGVYVLWGPSSSETLPRTYVGEGDPVLPRLDEHTKNKDFWTHGAVFTSKDENLNKAYVQHIEARLISLATRAKRCELDNANVPQLPSLSEADRDDAESFLVDMLLCLPLLGVHSFEQSSTGIPSAPEFHLRGKGIEARGSETPQGFIIRAGSTIVGLDNEATSIPRSAAGLRRKLVEIGVLERIDAGFKLTQDYVFSSPSAASDVVLGASSSGLQEWKDAKHRTLKEVREKIEGGAS